MGVPPKFKLSGEGTLGPIGELGEARQWSPTVLAKYYFNDGEAKFRPYVGLGATYVWYSDVKLTPGLQGALASRLRPAALGAVGDHGQARQLVHGGVQRRRRLPVRSALGHGLLGLVHSAQDHGQADHHARGFPVATSQSSLKVNPIVPYLAVTYKF